jgi:SAM-dependent methyltransferase
VTDNVFEAAYGGRAAAGSAIAATPWEIGRPQPVVERLRRDGAFRGRILDAGCGTGENALHLSGFGYPVVGVDISSTAIESARQKARERGLTAAFGVADATVHLGPDGSFDSALDCGLLHSLKTDNRQRYLTVLHRTLRAGARAHLLCFSDLARFDFPGGPRTLDEPTVRGLLDGAGWTLEDLSRSTLSAVFPDGERELPCWLATARRV